MKYGTDAIDEREKRCLSCQILDPIEDPEAAFYSMTGMEKIERRFRMLCDLTKYNVQRRMSCDLPGHKVNLHSLFLGPVGTGKSSVARLWGSMLKQAGVLSSGHVVCCDRTTFVGQYFGDEEKRVATALDLAHGGVLFIDEAYTLSTADWQDPGHNVLPLMLNALADESNRDICVVLAGYEKMMEDMISRNVGLASRFPNRFVFSAFSKAQLMEIAAKRLAKRDYTMTPEAWLKYEAQVDTALASRTDEFGNGRWVANTLDDVYMTHAQRCIETGIEGDDLLTITPDDISLRTPPPPRRIGFR